MKTSEFDSCVLQISVFIACGQVTHLQEGRGSAGAFWEEGVKQAWETKSIK